MLTQDIDMHEDRSHINSTADKWWNNMLAVVKLRQKGTTKVSKLPNGVFRCILEYQFPNEFTWKYADPYMPIKGQQDRHFPAIEKLSYDNYLSAVIELKKPNSFDMEF